MPTPFLSPYLSPILLLLGSNIFMTIAWYWHLRFKEVPLFTVILISWGLAFFEYCLAVRAPDAGTVRYAGQQGLPYRLRQARSRRYFMPKNPASMRPDLVGFP